jgi:2-C-methyl-D-erythritol 4-phosphate cytidylyltransferase
MAAGSGSRFGEEKQFKLLKGIALYFYSLNKFLLCENISEIILVVPESRLVEIKKEIANIKKTKNVYVISGGFRRQDSVKNGLLSVSAKSQLVCIHDGARPFVSEKLIKKSIIACSKSDGAIVANPNFDTLKICERGYVKKTIDRDNVWMAQTPQVFWKTKLLHAITISEKKNLEVTDESLMMESLGYKVSVVRGDYNNFKITSREDWETAENIIS